MRISDWSSDVCSSDLRNRCAAVARRFAGAVEVVFDAGIAESEGKPIAILVEGEVLQGPRPPGTVAGGQAADTGVGRRGLGVHLVEHAACETEPGAHRRIADRNRKEDRKSTRLNSSH